MRVSILLLAIGVLVGLQAAPAVALPGEEFDIPDECTFEPGEMGRYIVVFHDWVEDPEAVARDQVERYGGNLGFVYKHALNGYSAEYLPAAAEALQAEPTVKYVEVVQLIWMDESSGFVQWHSCPMAPPLGPAPPGGPEEPEEPIEPDPEELEDPEEPQSPEAPGITVPSQGAPAGLLPTEYQAAPATPLGGQPRAARCRRAKANRGRRCAHPGKRPTRICKQRAVAGKRRC